MSERQSNGMHNSCSNGGSEGKKVHSRNPVKMRRSGGAMADRRSNASTPTQGMPGKGQAGLTILIRWASQSERDQAKIKIA